MASKTRIPADLLNDPLAATEKGKAGQEAKRPRRRKAAQAAEPEPSKGGRPPGPGRGEGRPLRCTVYLRPEQYAALRAEVDRRLAALSYPERWVPAHERPDLSALVREAVDARFPPKGQRPPRELLLRQGRR